MIHFAYPNVKGDRFLGCGRYVALRADSVPTGYQFADPNTGSPSSIRMAASLLGRKSCDTGRYVYERKDDPDAKYVGSSLDLAYLLALVSRSKALRWEDLPHDIWCTGTIELLRDRPYLKEVASDPFDVKLESFISESNKDRLFITPAENIRPQHHSLIRESGAAVIYLGDLDSNPSLALSESKKILQVNGLDLDRLLNMIFSS